MSIAILFAAVLLILCETGKGWAFHNGGVGPCEGCHTMHNSITTGTTPSLEPNQLSENGNVTGWTGVGYGVNAVVNRGGSVGSAPSTYLLRGFDPSSTCLNCHEETGKSTAQYLISTAPSDMPAGSAPIELTPGGDFGWIKKTYAWGTYSDPGDLHGHNIVANDFYYSVGPDWAGQTAPGGTYPASDLTCVSCHDPHGTYRRKPDGSITNSPSAGPVIASGSYNTSPSPGAGQTVGAYRLLGGVGYLPSYLSANPSYAFTYPSPAAIAPSVYNQSERYDQVRVAYGNDPTNGGGMSDWCRNCHSTIHIGSGPYPNNFLSQAYSFPSVHQSGTINPISPSNDQLGSYISGSYISYIASGNYNGSSSTSYWSLTPFEEGTANYTTLASHANSNGTYLSGPASTDFVSCMSCHRAHASGWDYLMRFKYNGVNDGENGFSETITDSNNGTSVWPGTDTTPNDPNNAMGRTSAETQQAYYDRLASQFRANETTLCNKCHIGTVNGPTGQSGY